MLISFRKMAQISRLQYINIFALLITFVLASVALSKAMAKPAAQLQAGTTTSGPLSATFNDSITTLVGDFILSNPTTLTIWAKVTVNVSQAASDAAYSTGNNISSGFTLTKLPLVPANIRYFDIHGVNPSAGQVNNIVPSVISASSAQFKFTFFPYGAGNHVFDCNMMLRSAT